MSEVKPFAAFDVDGTIFKSSLLEKIIESSIADGLMPAEPFNEAYASKRRWQLRNNEGAYQAYLDRLVKAFVEQMTGISAERFQTVGTRMLEEQRARMQAFPRKLVRELQDSHYILALSGSPEILVEPFLERMGFDEVHGTDYKIEDGVFTGDFEMVGDKGRKLSEMIKSGLVSRLGSIAIGDTAGDISMLNQSSQPIMFNATRTLTHYGRDFGWTRVNEVKDQICVLQPDDEGTYREVDLGDYFISLRARRYTNPK